MVLSLPPSNIDKETFKILIENDLLQLIDCHDHYHEQIRDLVEAFSSCIRIENGVITVVGEGFYHLRSMLKYKDTSSCLCALWTIATLAGKNHELHEQIIEQIGWDVIVKFAKCDIDKIRETGCNIIANLSVNERMHGYIMNEGIFEMLKEYSKQNNNGIRRACCNTFGNLCSVKENCYEFIKDDILETIIELARYDNTYDYNGIQEYSLCTLANLANIPEIGRIIVEKGCLASIVPQLHASNISVTRGATSALANLVEYPFAHSEMVELDVIAKLLYLAGTRIRSVCY